MIRAIWHYLTAALMLLVLPMLLSHELSHAVPAMLRRDDDDRAMIYFGGIRHRFCFSLWRLDFSIGLPESLGLSPCCWWDWQHDSRMRKRSLLQAARSASRSGRPVLWSARFCRMTWREKFSGGARRRLSHSF